MSHKLEKHAATYIIVTKKRYYSSIFVKAKDLQSKYKFYDTILLFVDIVYFIDTLGINGTLYAIKVHFWISVIQSIITK